jgi:hypothetical protein
MKLIGSNPRGLSTAFRGVYSPHIYLIYSHFLAAVLSGQLRSPELKLAVIPPELFPDERSRQARRME